MDTAEHTAPKPTGPPIWMIFTTSTVPSPQAGKVYDEFTKAHTILGAVESWHFVGHVVEPKDFYAASDYVGPMPAGLHGMPADASFEEAVEYLNKNYQGPIYAMNHEPLRTRRYVIKRGHEYVNDNLDNYTPDIWDAYVATHAERSEAIELNAGEEYVRVELREIGDQA